MAQKKPHLNLAMIGHVDHGKSTLVGRMLYESGVIPEHVIAEYRRMAESMGKPTFEFAWTMDTLKEERERGLTIDISHVRFDTDKYYFTIVDCPGHRDFVKNMITGTSQADAAVLVVDTQSGIMPQTREHAILARTLGISQLVVVLNKMDLVDYKKEAYQKVRDDVYKMLRSMGFKDENLIFVPVDAFHGENVTKPSEKMPWWDGPSFKQALDMLKEPPKLIDKPLRIPVQDVFSITGVGTVPVGRVETGRLRRGDTVVFMPPGKSGEVKSIEMHHESIEEAIPGDNIGFNVRGISREELRRGDVAGHPDNPPSVVEEFTGQIVVLQHPTAIAEGYTPVFHMHTCQCACKIFEIVKKIDPRTGETLEESPDFIKSGEAAIIKVRPTRPIVVERAKDFPPLGRFAIRDMGITVGAGMVIDLVPRS